MNASEVKKLLAVIAARYPNGKVWDQDPQLTVQAWQMTLDDVTYEDAQRVLVSWFKAQKWAPDPSEIRALLVEMVAPIPSEGDAYRMALRWVRGQMGAGAPTTQDEHFAVACIRAVGEPKLCGQMEEKELRKAFGYEYRRMRDNEVAYRRGEIPSVGELSAANTMRALS